MKAFLKKLTSRKFLSMLAGVALGVWTVCRGSGGTAAAITGIAAMAAVITAYIVTEGNIDASAVSVSRDFVDKTLSGAAVALENTKAGLNDNDDN